MLRLLIVVLLPFLGLQAEEPKYPSKVGQAGTKDAFVNKTLQEREMDRMWVTENRSSTTEGSRGTNATSLPTTIRSGTERSSRRLPKPIITISSTVGTCNITLRCAVAEGGDVSYAWSNAKASAVLSGGPTLHITQKPPNGSLDYTCTVRNEESENASTVSLREHCHDPSSLGHGVSVSFYAKYVIPPLIVVLLLLGLFCMYRRKRGRGSHSSNESIYESSDSDVDHNPAVVARLVCPLEGFKSIPEASLEIMETCPIQEDPVISDQPPGQT